MLLEEYLVETQRPVSSPVRPLPPATPEQMPTLDEVEREHVLRVWSLTKGHKGRTCQILGISRPTLERKLKKYGIYAESE